MENSENLNVEKLINEIHIRPAIWDMRSEEYSNKIQRKRAWEEVTDAFVDADATEEAKKQLGISLQKKWKNIRDRYAREMKANKGKSGQGRTGKSAYMFTNQLGFLNDIIQNRPTDTSMDDTNPTSPNQETGLVEETPAIDDEPSAVHIAKKKKGNLVERKLLEALDSHQNRQKQKEQYQAPKESNEDDDRLFLLSLMPFLKTIPPHFKFAARMEIMQACNKFMTIQPPTTPASLQPPPTATPVQQLLPAAPPLHSQQLPNAPGYHQHQPGIQQWQYLDLPPYSQSSVHQQELQPGPSGIQQQRTETPLVSPANTVYSQSDSEVSLY